MKIYLVTDVYLLAEVFFYFRRFLHKLYGLDAANFISLPHFAYEAMLKMTGARMQLHSNVDEV